MITSFKLPLVFIFTVTIFGFLITFITFGNFCESKLFKHLQIREEIRPFFPADCLDIAFDETDKSSSNKNEAIINVAIPVTATGGHVAFVPDLIESAKQYLLSSVPLKKIYNVTFLIFTDNEAYITDHFGNDTRNIVFITQQSHGWRLDNLDRYSNYLENVELFKPFDFVVSMQPQMRFIAPVGGEILGDLFAGLHHAFYNISNPLKFPYERRRHLCASIPSGRGLHYYQSSFFGGKTGHFLKLVCTIHKCLQRDYKSEGKKAIERIQDESYLNRFLLEHNPTTILNSGYGWPAGFHRPNFKVKIEVINVGIEHS